MTQTAREDRMGARGSNDEVRKAAILDAAAQLIAERGYHAVRIADIAKIVGSSTGAVHYYFPGKSDVLRLALNHAITRAFARQSAELKNIPSARERLLKLIDMQLPRIGQVRDEWSVWVQFWAEAAVRPELRPEHNEFYARWRETVERIIERGQRAGEFRADVDPSLVAMQLTAMTDGAAIQVLTGSPGLNVTAMRELLIAFVQSALVD
ncbi:TetR/AcrR family transcriptional regulator [Sinomonas terrae]|uniref:TetR family transcriptional regulator n=1 Tax=Sinomonas terrae TaxID=2908838 RepID=A0ABS9TWY1_9MICC|nr:TetR/AcrR family transcriptional regulator [Sinomonas terrae]MCH6468908.1 TetR family transcriptional regulator [Sinomonas terrae]